MDTNLVVPIEDSIEFIVGQEITLETTQEVLSGYHSNNTPDSDETIQDKNQWTVNIVDRLTEMQKQMASTMVVDSGTNIQKEIKEDLKRHRDKMKKRIRRTDVEFRKRETVKARERMANRRNDLNYREVERQRDRERRALARKNSAVREKEKEKDRLHKKRLRLMYLQKERLNTGQLQERERHVITGTTKDSVHCGSKVDCNTGCVEHYGVTCTKINSHNDLQCSESMSVLNYSSNQNNTDKNKNMNSKGVISSKRTFAIQVKENNNPPIVVLTRSDAVSSDCVSESETSELKTEVNSTSKNNILEFDSGRTFQVQCNESKPKMESNCENTYIENNEISHKLELSAVQEFAALLAEHESLLQTRTQQNGSSITVYSETALNGAKSKGLF